MNESAGRVCSSRICSLLIFCGIDPRQPWWHQGLSLFFVLPLPDPRRRPWQERLAIWFPQINFHRLHPGDVIRIPIQILWLILVRHRQLSPPDRLLWHEWVKIRFAWVGTVLSAQLRRHFLKGTQELQTVQALLAPFRKLARDQVEISAGHKFWASPFIRYAAYAISFLLAALCMTTPFNTLAQMIFVGLLWGIALVVRRITGPVVTLLLILLSITVSTRYLWWRVSYTLNWDAPLDLFWGVLLLAAECYIWLVLLLGYAQTVWPLQRKPVPLPADQALWPTVDVYIPTYNEPLKVVKPTVFAAMNMDWPQDKLNVYLLDDGRRDEFRSFAKEVGVDYIVRNDNLFAKAGNINNALSKTVGEFIAIFDCDHIPTRSFLQVNMGWFLRDRKLALMQTPHHFFSQDPFERNLGTFRQVPNEGELFYGLIQDGNDLWNATFFCGSCAVLRREPLAQVGGIAVETVTEDAHTALKLHRRGYTSAYLNTPQAAGLATESLSAHIGQRIRWARGMAQIFRLDSPFLGKGLSFMQRLCYGNAMLHFLNGIPRLIFLTAPLAFLLFHSYVIFAPAISVVLYVLPHLLHSSLTNSRIQGGYRHSFWAEIYETVLAWYIARPTFVALFNPGKGKFNVTAKGGGVEHDFFDWNISLPYLILILFNAAGFLVGIGRIIWGPGDEIPTVIINLFWILYNAVILGGASAVALEMKQIRRSHRVGLKLPAVLHLLNGKLFPCQTSDFSEGGVALTVGLMPNIKDEERVMVSLWRGEEEHVFPARVVKLSSTLLRLRWELLTLEQEAALVHCTFGRADAWVSWADTRQRDRPLKSLREVFVLGVTGYIRIGEQFLPFFTPLRQLAARFGVRVAWWLPRSPIPTTR